MADAHRRLEDSFLQFLQSINLSEDVFYMCIQIASESFHHPDFDAELKSLHENGTCSSPERFLYYIFGEVALHSHNQLALHPEFFARRNCEIEEAIANRLETFETWSRAQYDRIEAEICTYCAKKPPKRLRAKNLIQYLKTSLGDDINGFWADEKDALKRLGHFFGFPDFFLQQGPREAVLAVYQERNCWNSPMMPLSDPNDFPDHEAGDFVAKVYCEKSDLRSHTDAHGKKLVSKKIPKQLLNMNADPLQQGSRDFPPTEIHTNLILQEYFSFSPNLYQPCPYIVQHKGTTEDDSEKVFYYWMEGGEDYIAWICKGWKSAAAQWRAHIKENRAVKGLYKRQKSPWHKERTHDFIRILAAVKYMHEMKIYHRDIKTQNVIIVDGIVKLIDFGVSVRLSMSDQSNRATDLVGTPNFCSPECYHVEYENNLGIQAKDYDCEKNDVWCLGHILCAITLCTNLYSTCSLVDPVFRSLTEDSYLPKEERQKGHTIRKLVHSKRRKIHATDDLIDLLQNIFCPESERFSIDEIFEHEWLMEELREMKDELAFLNRCQFYKEFFGE